MKIDYFDELNDGEIVKYVTTPDDFFPNYEGDTVEVALVTVDDGRKIEHRVVVSGQDDFSLAYESGSSEEAVELFNWIKDGITKEALCTNLFDS